MHINPIPKGASHRASLLDKKRFTRLMLGRTRDTSLCHWRHARAQSALLPQLSWAPSSSCTVMAWGPSPSLILSAATLALLAIFFASSTQSPQLLSPQGCRMSYMWPTYVLQHDFNSSWTRLARRYSLWLYREANRESHDQARIVASSSL